MRAAGGDYRDLVAAREGPLRTGSPMGIYWRGYSAADGGMVIGALTKANRDAIRGVLGIDDDPTDDLDYNALDPANLALVEQLRARVSRNPAPAAGRGLGRTLRGGGRPVAPVVFPEDLPDHEEGGRHFGRSGA